MVATKKLYRSNDSVVAGVCAGIASYLDIDSAIVRILAVFLLVASGGMAGVLYLVMWWIVPRQAVAGVDTIPAAASAEGYPYQQPSAGPVYAEQPPYPYQGQAPASPEGPSGWAKFGAGVGLVFLAMGISGIVGSVVDGVYWWQLWPAAVILGAFVSAFASSSDTPLSWRISRSLALFAMGIVLLCCSMGLLAWASVPFAIGQLWPGVFIFVGIAILGAALHNNVLPPVFALCVILVCLAAMTVYAIPGPLNAVSLDMPFADARMVDINPWR